MLDYLRTRLGRGMLLAAAAVGTSHLVQSTRAGATYALTFAGLNDEDSVQKYPVFRFAAEYAAATGNSLIEGYALRGRWLVVLMLAATAIEGVGAVAGVGLVTTGIGKLIFGIALPDRVATIGLLVATAAILILGNY